MKPSTTSQPSTPLSDDVSPTYPPPRPEPVAPTTKDANTANAVEQPAHAIATDIQSTEGNSRWEKAYTSAYSRLPASVTNYLPTAAEAHDAVDSMSARFSKSVGDSNQSLKERRAKLRSEFFSHGYSVANATQIPLYISLNQVGPLMYEAVAPNHVFERRVPGLYFFLEVRASGGAYTPWSVAWPILAVTGPAVALSSLAAIPLAAAVTGSATLAGLSTAVYSGIASAGTTAAAAGTKIASAAARLSILPGGKKLHGKLVEAAKAHVAEFKQMGKQHVLQYATAAFAAITGKAAKQKVETEGDAPAPPRDKLGEVDVTGYPLVKVLACKTGNRKLDDALESAFKKLDFKTRDFQPKTNPVLRVVGGPELDERDGKLILVFYPLSLEHIVDLQAEPIPTEEVPPTADEQCLAQDARLVDTWEEASVTSEDAPPYAGEEDDPKKKSWLDSWRRK